MVFREHNISPPRVSLNLVLSKTFESSPSPFTPFISRLLLLLLDLRWKRASGGNRQKTWLTKIQLDRFCLVLSRFIEVHRVLYRATFLFFRSPDSILRDFSRPAVIARCDRHFAVARKRDESEKIEGQRTNQRMMQFYTNRWSQFVTSIRQYCNSVVCLLLFPI